MPRPKIDDANARNSVKKLILMRPDEKDAFDQCAALTGLPLSLWMRERLRSAAIRELESAGRKVPFVRQVLLGNDHE